MKKLLGLLLILVMSFTLLMGCNKDDSKKASKDGDSITLKWAVWDINSTTYYQPLIDAYEEKNSNVKIEMVDLGSADFMTVLATELTGNDSDIDIAAIKDIPGYATLVGKN